VGGVSVLERLNVFPLFVLESEDVVGDPVDGVESGGVRRREGWHSEGEHVARQLRRRVVDLVRLHVQEGALVGVLAAEAAHDQNAVLVELSGTETLSRIQHTVLDLDDLPLGDHVVEAVGDVETFDGGQVLFGLVRDAAEHVYPLTIEVATGVVVTALVKHRQLAPLVLLHVVQLNTAACLLNVFAGTSHHEVAVLDSAGGVAMSGVTHLRASYKLELIFGFLGQLACLVHRVWVEIEVTSSKHEYFCGVTNLHHRVVVGVGGTLGATSLVARGVEDEGLGDMVAGNVIEENRFGVLVKHVDYVP